jgi:transcriptional regulator with XRE-family HTH domain
MRVLNYKQMAYLFRMFPTNRLRELRKSAKLTQQQLAEMSGVTQSTISQLENDTLNFNTMWMRTFARIFSDRLNSVVTPVDLLGDEDYPNRLSPEEEELVRQFRQSDEQQREMILRVAAPVRPFLHFPQDKSRNAA